jgi:hypothetical protein
MHIYKRNKPSPELAEIPGIITLANDGEIKWEKSFKIGAVQQFFRGLDRNIQYYFPGVLRNPDGGPEEMVKEISKAALRDIRKLRKELEHIEKDNGLLLVPRFRRLVFQT